MVAATSVTCRRASDRTTAPVVASHIPRVRAPGLSRPNEPRQMPSGERHHRRAAGHGRRPTLIVRSNDGCQVAGLIDVTSILSPPLV